MIINKKVIKRHFKKYLRKFGKRTIHIPFMARLIKDYMLKSKRYVYEGEIAKFLGEGEDVTLDWDEFISKPFVGLVKEESPLGFDDLVDRTAYWPVYEKFLRHNEIPYEFYNVHLSTWQEEAKKYDIIIWHTEATPARKHEAESKIYILEKILQKLCLPSYDEVWSYEDKVRMSFLLKAYDLPGAKTFITFNKKEALNQLGKHVFPVVSKITTSASSYGVELIKDKNQGKRFIGKVFGLGYKTHWGYFKLKDYIYWQEFIEDTPFDLRIIVVDNKVFGSYRFPNKGDFRASGAGNLKFGPLPQEAMNIAVETHKKLKSRILAVDFVYSPSSKQYYIIEASIFIAIGCADQLIIDNTFGYYYYSEMDGEFLFKEGSYWIQELTLKTLMNEWLEKEKKDV